MSDALKELLFENGYIFSRNDQTVMIGRRVVSSWIRFWVFGSVGLIVTLVSLVFLSGNILGAGVFSLAFGVVLLGMPFYAYLFAPYHGVVFDIQNKALLFRSGRSRAYRFEEVDSLEWNTKVSDADTSAFSDSNEEHRCYFNLVMRNGIKEELFYLSVDRALTHAQIKELHNVFEEILV